jgi:uncharacterized protein YgbK (DUF1537 family)
MHALPKYGPVPLDELTANLPPPRTIDSTALATQVAAGRTLVVLDDDPTGTQSITDLPLLTRWRMDDLRWALRQGTAAFFVLTNTRGLDREAAAAVNREIARELARAAAAEGEDYVIASRSDSTLRGHYPLETDVLADELAAAGRPVDGLVIVPAFIEPGRVTIDSVHWMRSEAGMIPVSSSEFARDASFGYRNADLRDWVEEKTGGRIRRAEVATVPLRDLRDGGPGHVEEILRGLTGARPVVVDAATDDDLRVLVQALIAAEADGKRFLYRTGPSFVRARTGQVAVPPVDARRLRQVFREPPRGDRPRGDRPREDLPREDLPREDLPCDEQVRDQHVRDQQVRDDRPHAARGLVAVGSHVAMTTRQLDRLRAEGGIAELELDVPTLLDRERAADHLAAVTRRATELLTGGVDHDLVVRTSRTQVTTGDVPGNLAIARTVSAALVAVVRTIVSQVRPRFVLAKGGITASDTATDGLDITRAWSRGTLLPGMVAVWEPVGGPGQGIPYVVFPGNVGDDDGLLHAVRTLRQL